MMIRSVVVSMSPPPDAVAQRVAYLAAELAAIVPLQFALQSISPAALASRGKDARSFARSRLRA
jgi:hypothetical protein